MNLFKPSLQSLLPAVLPTALDWAREMEVLGCRNGKILAPWQCADARDVGVAKPECVRLCIVEKIPTPRDPILVKAAQEFGILTDRTLGLALGYCVFVRRSHIGRRQLLRHELRHVAQMETAGGLIHFLPAYLQQVAEVGYEKAPYEVDARAHEKRPTCIPE